ncbi:MAG TPA: hypothetical protein VG796_13705 [Verrucomicrobiales bacterium]|nr:hypothetical protein [Verrucomicrobiales bacterium]
MKAHEPVEKKIPAADPHDFSLVLGGPLFQFLQRSRLSGCALELMWRRLLVITLIAWLPLLILSLLDGKLMSGSVTVPFLYDVDAHVRFLIALPLLVIAELVVHLRMRPVISLFLTRNLIGTRARTKFEAALASTLRLRNSVAAELLLLALVYGVGVLFIWRSHAALHMDSWYGRTVDGKWVPSLAGWWLGFVSLPFFQFLLLRWYFRIFLWARLLWRVSRLDLQLVPTHPDRCGGLGFLSGVCFAFAPLILAQGALLSGTIANQIFFTGAKLFQFKIEIAAVSAVVLLAVAGPLLVFAPVLSRLKRAGLRDYGTIAQEYVAGFDRKWLRGDAPDGETLLGSGDIQSLADLNNSFEVVRTMKTIPFTKEGLVHLAVLALLPVLPLSLTLISLEDLMQQLLKVLF